MYQRLRMKWCVPPYIYTNHIQMYIYSTTIYLDNMFSKLISIVCPFMMFIASVQGLKHLSLRDVKLDEWLPLLCILPGAEQTKLCQSKHLSLANKNEFTDYLWYDFGHIEERHSKDGKVMTSERLAEKQQGLRHLWKHVQPVLEDNNMTYWASDGTLLGAVRESNMIAFDDDMDIVITKEDYERLEKKADVLKQLKEKHQIQLVTFDVEDITLKYLLSNLEEQAKMIPGSLGLMLPVLKESKLPFIEGGQMYQFQYKDVWIDVFQVYKTPENHDWKVANKGMQIRFPNDWFEDSNVFPLKTYDFGQGQTIKGPWNPEPYFVRNYGKDWQTPRKSHEHFEQTGTIDVTSRFEKIPIEKWVVGLGLVSLVNAD